MRQYEIQRKIQEAGFNVCTCGSCGGVILTDILDKKRQDIFCPHCEINIAYEHCPDLCTE